MPFVILKFCPEYTLTLLAISTGSPFLNNCLNGEHPSVVLILANSADPDFVSFYLGLEDFTLC